MNSRDIPPDIISSGVPAPPLLHHMFNNSSTSLQLQHQQQQEQILRRREYRVALDIFNRGPPERGIQLLIQKGFIGIDGPVDHKEADQQELLASSVAHFLLTRKGISKQMIGVYLANPQNAFNQLVLHFFLQQIDLYGLSVDEALRKFQTTFRFPGESQQIQRLVEKFADRYIECNPILPRSLTKTGSNSLDSDSISFPSDESCDKEDQSPSYRLSELVSRDEVFILSFAIIMLNTDLHTPQNKTRMTCDQWIRNLRGALSGGDLSDSILIEIYERIRDREFQSGLDHVSQVRMLQQQLMPGKSMSSVPSLTIPERRLVCYCRLFEVPDITRRDRPGQHQREIFLFNDLLLVTKLVYVKSNTRKNNTTSTTQSINSDATNGNSVAAGSNSSISSSGSSTTTTTTAGLHHPSSGNMSSKVGGDSMFNQLYSYRSSHPLLGLYVKMFVSPFHPFGIKIIRRIDDHVILTLNARNAHDRNRFVMDMKESIEEMNLMEATLNMFN